MIFEMQREDSNTMISGYLYRRNKIVGPEQYLQIQKLTTIDLGDDLYIKNPSNNDMMNCVSIVEVLTGVCYTRIRDKDENLYFLREANNVL